MKIAHFFSLFMTLLTAFGFAHASGATTAIPIVLTDPNLQTERALIECGIDWGMRLNSGGRLKVCLLRSQRITVAEEPVYVLRIFRQDSLQAEDFVLLGFFPEPKLSWERGREVLRSSLVGMAQDQIVQSEVYLENPARGQNESIIRLIYGTLPDGGRFRADLSPVLTSD